MTVTIEIPASVPAQLKKPEGDAGGADTLATTLYAAAGRYEEFADRAKQLQDLGSWTGVAYRSYKEASGEASGEHSAMATTVRRVGRGVTAFADTLRDLLREHEELVERKRSLDARRTQLIADINAATDPTENDIAAFRERAVDLRADYSELVTADDDLQRRVRENETLLRQVFEASDTLSESLSADGGIPPMAESAMNLPGAPGSGATPEEVQRWWEGLSEAEREAVIAAYPERIGQGDGLPADARDQANRVLLDDDLARLASKEADGTIDPLERKVLANAQQARDSLANADAYTDPLDPGVHPGGQLWLYDPAAYDGDGRVAVAVGDLDTATDVAVMTPGINTDMSDTTYYTDRMMNLYESTRYNGDGSSVATMYWLGYDAPHGPTDLATLTEGRAEEGGRNLADAIDGLRASRPDDPAHLTAIGHSYGSTTTAYATHGNDAVDDVVLIGSPGAGPADTAADLGQGNVYVGRDSRDFVAVLGDEGWIGKFGLGLGTDPSSEDFEATRFEAEDVDRSWIRNTGDAHSSYFDNDSESLYNIGRIVDGHGGDVNEAEQSYDPWWGPPQDPEWDRDPTADQPGRSDTTARR
ncbi:pimeloyl-ACP methyl ester carboxylesterase [Nocardioides cavernae]|uniref:Pimeloyl-ACP methyl ester carboxylesterase n=1 Tax=Nocardioides cavernae TaxID=1921566 RepID=A0A7Y9KSI5_9ACTN|nr:alpha/beta hydrolase [Nocardioides cavernae]NYE35863.1 pimeloyl-ACP methyl ester carboxylesterase [Nocardioides cavernae]